MLPFGRENMNNKKTFFKKNSKHWYKPSSILHFDKPIKNFSQKLVNEYELAYNEIDKEKSNKLKEKFNFFPFIHYIIINKLKYVKKNKEVKKPKERKIFYSSHIARLIYSYYAQEKLIPKYEEEINKRGISESIIAYRKKHNNINSFLEATKIICNYQNCVCLCFDIKGFFDNIDHKNLKKQWCNLLNENKLPNDHFKIFDSITKYQYIKRSHFNEFFTYNSKKNPEKRTLKDFNKKSSNKEYLTITQTFKKKKTFINKKGSPEKLIKQNTKSYGIPQGTTISGFLSNLFMIDFDTNIKNYLSNYEGIYRRYSDDILFIIKIAENDNIEELTNNIKDTLVKELEKLGSELKLKDDKTETSIFKNLSIIENNNYKKAFNYLGFSFDGNKILLRDSTVSRHYIRINSSIKKLKKFNKKAKSYNEINRKINIINHNYLPDKEKRLKRYIFYQYIKKSNKKYLYKSSFNYKHKKDYSHGNIHSYTKRFSTNLESFSQEEIPEEISLASIKGINLQLKNTKKFIKNNLKFKVIKNI